MAENDSEPASAVAGVTAPRAEGHAPPGAVFAVVEDGRTDVSASGVADVETGAPMTVAHAFDLASVSKTLTTLTVRRLIHLGALADDTTLGAILGARAGGAAEVTIDDLLRHRAGLREWWPLYLAPEAVADPVAGALSLAPRYPRGAGRHYSDLGMQALGAVIAQVTGSDFAAAVRQVLLDPLAAASVSPGGPVAGTPVAAGPDGDAIEREMVRSGVPYPVDVDAAGFPWRSGILRGEIADGNAFHAFGGAAGHAGWFGDAEGMLRIAAAIAAPEAWGLGVASGAAFRTAVDAGQGQGLLHYRVRWRGRERLFLGHSGFTGTLVAAAPASDGQPAVLTVLLTNRLHGRPAPRREHLVPVDLLWREAISRADALLHPSTTGATP
ncbi:serine hydrolase domain-containing protein [Microbacterium lushaniae]|uniref:Beta-lactamase family protein n=1 Tax=Microbacterium lushaniae TaxID=2614639 RepID=A0A5J6L0N7_9MICO|nr:serine hydrolase domain-containing protein [Microbacterium lushaniae]QEW01946.1 beta-lactamase family protein [Microbacterium lushaniae]